MLNENVALAFMMKDLVVNILNHSEDPGYLSNYLTEQIKELIGCDIVALVKCRKYLNKENGEILKILPERLNKEKLRENILSFTKKNHQVDDAAVIYDEVFKRDVLILPLFSSNLRIGELIIINPYEKKRYEEIKKLLYEFQELFSLILKNSYLYRELETKVAARTKEIKERETIWRKLTSVSPVAIFRTDITGNLLFFNNKFTEITGIDKKDILFSEIELVYELLKEKRTEKEIYFKKTDKWGYLQLSSELDDIQGTVQTYTGTITDITERVKIESILVQNEKMVTMGELSAGIAHELNNPLSGILQSLQNISRRIDPDIETNKKTAEKYGIDLKALKGYLKDRQIDYMLNSIKDAGERASDIVSNMLDFSRTNSHKMIRMDIKEILQSMLKIADSDYDLEGKYDIRNINIKTIYSKESTVLDCFPSELEQVFINIIKNASQELNNKENTDPTIIIKTTRSAENIVVEILNNGSIPSEKEQKLMFEPFFTTKDPDKGTGLGLSVAKYIVVKKHKGHITPVVDSGLFGIRVVLPISN